MPSGRRRGGEIGIPKRLKYRDILPEYTFRAIGLETLGSLGPSARSFFTSVSRRLQRASELSFLRDPREYMFFLQRVSIILIRSNSMSIVGSMPLSA